MLDRTSRPRPAWHSPQTHPDRATREVRLEGAFNVRDLGGIPVGRGARITRGLVYRGDSLDSLTEADRSVLFGDLRIGMILDLRTPEEAGGDGRSDERLFPSVRVHSFPVIPDGRIGVEPFPVGDAEAVAKHYVDYVIDRGPVVAGVVKAIAASVAEQTPALFHCAAGRDRTGVVAAVVLSLLGVADREIVADYVDSNREAEAVSQRLTLNPLYRGDEAAASSGTNLVDPEAIRQFLELFRVEFGSATAWARRFGLTRQTLTNLRAALLR